MSNCIISFFIHESIYKKEPRKTLIPHYFKLPGTDLDNRPEAEVAVGETAGRKIFIGSPPSPVGK